jgi:hypothetical protein
MTNSRLQRTNPSFWFGLAYFTIEISWLQGTNKVKITVITNKMDQNHSFSKQINCFSNNFLKF